jgi:integrase/recombinase XerD
MKGEEYMCMCDNHSQDSIIVESIKECLTGLRKLNYRPTSIELYEKGFRNFEGFLTTVAVSRIQDVTFEHLHQYHLSLMDKELSDATITLYLRCVRRLFSFLEENHSIFINPARELIIPRYALKLQPVPSEEEIKQLLMQPNTDTPLGIRDRALLETAYSCGARLEELTELTILAPDITQGTLRIMGKGRKERVVPLGKKAVFWMKCYMEEVRLHLCKNLDENALWISRGKGAKLSYHRIDQLIREYAKMAKIPIAVSAHSLRRSCATHMLRAGAHPLQIQMLLGHATLKTLGQYLRVTITDMKTMHEGSTLGR